MSRQSQFPLLKWRQGAGQRFISHKTRPMNQILFDCARFTSYNLLVRVHLLGVGSTTIFWALVVSSMTRAQANLPTQRSIRCEQNRVIEQTKLEEFNTQEQESSALPTIGSALAVRGVTKPTAREQTVVEQPTADLVQEKALIDHLSREVAVTPSFQKLIPQPVFVQPSSTPVAKEHSITATNPKPLVGLSSAGEAPHILENPQIYDRRE